MILRFYNIPVKINFLQSPKTFLDPYLFALYHQDFNHFQIMEDIVPFTLYFIYDKTKPHTFQPLFLKQALNQVHDQILQNVFLQTPNETDPSMLNSHVKTQVYFK